MQIKLPQILWACHRSPRRGPWRLHDFPWPQHPAILSYNVVQHPALLSSVSAYLWNRGPCPLRPMLWNRKPFHIFPPFLHIPATCRHGTKKRDACWSSSSCIATRSYSCSQVAWMRRVHWWFDGGTPTLKRTMTRASTATAGEMGELSQIEASWLFFSPVAKWIKRQLLLPQPCDCWACSDLSSSCCFPKQYPKSILQKVLELQGPGSHGQKCEQILEWLLAKVLVLRFSSLCWVFQALGACSPPRPPRRRRSKWLDIKHG